MHMDTFEPDSPATCEIAVKEGDVIINYKSTVPVGAWGHLSFTPAQADILIQTLQTARKNALTWPAKKGRSN